MPTSNYQEENKRRRKAVEEENEFLKENVIGQGVNSTTDFTPTQNIQSDMERSLDESESSRSTRN